MDIRILFRATIPGYTLIIPLFFYLRHLTCFSLDAPVIAALITAGFPFGFFLEWITEGILHIWHHPIIVARILRTILALKIGSQQDIKLKGFLSRNIKENCLRGLFNFVLHSNKKFKSHLERHSLLASRTHSVSESMMGIIIGNTIGLLILSTQKGMYLWQNLSHSGYYKDLWWTIIISSLIVIIFYFFYSICRDDLIAYEKMIINRYKEDFGDAWKSLENLSDKKKNV